MQYVRCEACGAKALLAASQCPKCSNPLQLRDHHGEFVSLTQCRKCDTWYPTSRGGCKWCGTKPGSGPSSRVFAGIGASLAVAALVWWMVARMSDPAASEARSPAAEIRPPADSLPSVASVTVTPSVTAPPESSTFGSDTTARGDSVTNPAPNIAPPPAPAAALPPGVMQPPTGFTRSGIASPDTYINLRTEPDRAAAIVGTINPGTQVETGARFRGWRQVRTPAGQVGWVDPRHLVDIPTRPR